MPGAGVELTEGPPPVGGAEEKAGEEPSADGNSVLAGLLVELPLIDVAA